MKFKTRGDVAFALANLVSGIDGNVRDVKKAISQLLDADKTTLYVDRDLLVKALDRLAEETEKARREIASYQLGGTYGI